MVEGIEFMYIAYTGVWVGLLFYLVYIHLFNQKLAQMTKDLEDMVRSHGRRKE